MDWNTRSASQHRVGMGMGCLARQGERVVLATCGPASILHASGSSVTLYEPDDEHAEPMTGLDPNQPQLTSLSFAPGDRVLLVTTNIAESLSEDALTEILSRSLTEVLPNLYRRITHLRDAAVLLVGAPLAGEAFAEPPAPDEPQEPMSEPDPAPEPIIGGEATADGSSPDFQPSFFVQSGPEETTALERARQRLADVDARSRVDGALPEVTPLAQPGELPVLKRAVGDGGEARAFPPAGRLGAAGGSFFREVAHARQPPAPTLDSHQTGAAPVNQLAADRRMQVAATTHVPSSGRMAATPLAGGARVRARSHIGGGFRGGWGAGRARASTGGFSPPTWIIVTLAAALLAAGVGWATLPGLFASDDSTRLSSLLEEAEREVVTASAVERADLRREALTNARGLLLEAMALEGSDASRAGDLLQQVDRELGRLDAISAPAEIRPLADLRGFGEAPIAARRLAVSDSHAYILDSAGAQVIAVSLSTGKKAIAFAQSEQTPRAPVAITYADVSRPGGSAVLIADEGGALWTWNPAGWVSELEFARPEGMSLTDIHFTNGWLYALDATAATVYRFSAGTAGFSVEPETVLETPDLASARRIMVDRGGILTAGADGAIRRFSGEFTLVLGQGGIDKPLAAAATPHTDGLGGEIAVLDASADRIVILAQDGAFVRQYRHEDLEHLAAFTVRDGFGYVISGEQLLRITF